MTMRGFLTLSLAALASAAVPAAVQAAPGSIGKNQEAREALGALASCIVKVRGGEVRAFLRAPSEDGWYPVVHYANDDAPCVGFYSVTAEQTAMRGAVAEAWYLSRFAGGAPTAFANAENAAPSQEETAARIIAASESDRPQVVVDEFARCVAAVAPVGVDALLRTPVASAAEAKAVSALSASFGPCAFEGQQLAFDAETLRAALAFALATRAVRETAA